MAITLTLKLSQTSSAPFGTGAFTSNSFTPANNSLLIAVGYYVAVVDTGSDGSALTIGNSAGLSFTARANTINEPGWTYGIRMWTAPVTTGASMTVSLDAGTENVHVYQAAVFEATGYDTGTPTGATAAGTDADGDGAASITLSGSPASTSYVIAAAIKAITNTVGSFTHGTGWAEDLDTGVTDWIAFQAQHRTGSTSTTVGWDDLDVSGSSIGAAMLALEIKAAAGGGGSSIAAISSGYHQRGMR